jgi:hypothetical protein
LAWSRSRELVELDDRWLQNRLIRFVMRRVDRSLYRVAATYFPCLNPERVTAVTREGRALLDGVPFGECVLTIGSALLAWRTRPIDGVVVVGPWGCGPALISEAQLRRRPDIPTLFVYNDGDPIEEARLQGFAWRLRRREARQVPR